MISKVSVIGAGSVGATCAHRIVERGYADVVLLDIAEGLAKGRALDIMGSAPILRFDTQVIGTSDYRETADSDLVVITSGLPRKPGMTRDELLERNKNIVVDVCHSIVEFSPDSIVLVVTNPVDVMTYVALRTTTFPRNRVLGLSGALDTARLRRFIAEACQVSVEDVSGWVLGQHGESMVVIPRLCTVWGIPIDRLLPQETIEGLVQRTIGAGAEILSQVKTGSAFYGPSAALAQMVEAIILDKKQTLPCAIYLCGEYGIENTVLSIPAKLGRGGIEQVVQFQLTEDEKSILQRSARTVRELLDKIGL